MAKIDVREAEAGCAMDAACAEVFAELMGWELAYVGVALIHYDRPDGRSLVVERPRKTTLHESITWKPSRDISAAWELVGAMLAQDDQQKWLVFADLLYGYTPVLAPRHLAALRIARAFLLAHGVKEIEMHEEGRGGRAGAGVGNP